MLRRKVTEEQAAAGFISGLLDKINADWVELHGSLKAFLGQHFEIQNESKAKRDLLLAVTAVAFQAIANLFPIEQAARLRNLVMNILNTERLPGYNRTEIQEYTNVFEAALKTISLHELPLDAVADRLLHQWIGSLKSSFEIAIDHGGSSVPNPVVSHAIGAAIMGYQGYWKAVKDRCILIESDQRTGGSED